MCPPALSSMFVVANVAELGKQVKKEDTVLEIPWANSSWPTTVIFTRSENQWVSFAALASHLVGMDGISVLVGIDHGQWDWHGVTDKSYGHRVSCDVRESVQGGEFGLWESGRTREFKINLLEDAEKYRYASFEVITLLGCGRLSRCCS